MITGILLIISSVILMSKFFSKNEWRIPLLELSNVLEGEAHKKMQAGVKRRMVFIAIFFLLLFFLGGWSIVGSPIFSEYQNIILIILGIILLWLLKGLYGIFRACYSKKTKLLNYLYSPYLFVWKRDFLSKYSDYEVAAAILEVCDIRDKSLLNKNMNLQEFLINLHQETRSSAESEYYLTMLKKNILKAKRVKQR